LRWPDDNIFTAGFNADEYDHSALPMGVEKQKMPRPISACSAGRPPAFPAQRHGASTAMTVARIPFAHQFASSAGS